MCYLRALDSCYDKLAEKKTQQKQQRSKVSTVGNGVHHPSTAAAEETEKEMANLRETEDLNAEGAGDCREQQGRPFVLGDVDHVLCHSPYNKLVQKSFARLAFADAQRLHKAGKALVGGDAQEEALRKWLGVPAQVNVTSSQAFFPPQDRRRWEFYEYKQEYPQ